MFKRRFAINREKKEVVIMSEAVNADFLPEEKGVHRVNEYWSTMVIRAKGDIDQVWKDSCFYFVNFYQCSVSGFSIEVTNVRQAV